VQVESSIHEQILQLEQRLLDPSVRKSSTELDRLLADNFLEFGHSGAVYRKRDAIDALQRESAQEWTLANFHVAALSNDIALATYRATQRATPGNVPIHSLRSSIWKLNLGNWQLFFHQGTSCPPST
jgi:hypothetical protein